MNSFKKIVVILISVSLFFTTNTFSFFGFEPTYNENILKNIEKTKNSVKKELPELFNYDLANLYLEIGEKELAGDEVSYAFEKLFFFEDDYFNSPEMYPEIISLFDFYNRNKTFISEYIDTSDLENNGNGELSPLDEIESEKLICIKIDPSVESKLMDDVKKLKFDFPVVVNKKVIKWMNYFLNGRGYKRLIRGLRRLGRYEKIFKKIFKEEGLPQDLIYFGLVESNFNPNAYSRARARGIWQFISWTARKYGLRVDWWVDERSDPIKSTYAACRYLKDLYDMFGDWYLVLAAYNSGEGRIQRLVSRYKTNDYWKISKKWRLPRETREYVPLILAAMIIAKNPEIFGIHVDRYDPFKYKIATIPSPTDLRIVADLLNMDVNDLKEYNPQLRRLVTPPDVRMYKIYLPSDISDEKLAELYTLPKQKRLKWVKHRVRRGDTLSKIARMYGSSISSIRDVNNIRNVRRLRIGQILIIPLSPIARKLRYYRQSKRYRLNRDNTYTVRRGDNLWRISRAFGVDVEYLKKINGLKGRWRVYLKPGMKLKIPVDSGRKTFRKRRVKRYKPKTGNGYYVVRRGDTLWSISRRYGISLRKLCKLNHISKHTKLRVGMRLRVNSKITSLNTGKKSAFIKHRVRKGETLYSISKRYNVRVKDIKKYNKIRRHLIKPNMILLIPVRN